MNYKNFVRSFYMRFIDIDKCVKFITNGCYTFLDSQLKNNTSERESLKVAPDISVRYDSDSFLTQKYDSNYIFKQKIERITMKEDDKIKCALYFRIKDGEQLKNKYKVEYENLFNEKIILELSEEYITKVVKVLINGLNSVPQDLCKFIYKINNSCEFCDNHDDCLGKINNGNLVEKISMLSFEDIEYLHSKGIYTISQLQEKLENLKDATESFKDKTEDLKTILEDTKKDITLKKYFLDWNENRKEAETCYAVTFEGDSETDIVYSFSYRNMFAEQEIKHFILSDNDTKNNVLKHYKDITKAIHEIISNNNDNGKDTVFYVLAPYARNNFEKIIEMVLSCKDNFDSAVIDKALVISEYFGMKYYSEKNTIAYKNQYVDTWVDLRIIIDKRLYTGIDFINSFVEIYRWIHPNASLLERGQLDSHNYSWALKPKYIHSVWEGGADTALKKILERKLSGMVSLNIKIKNALKGKTIYPDKKIFESKESFLDRFLLKETIVSIKENKQQLADFTLQRLLEKGEVLKLTNLKYIKNYEKTNKKGYKEKFLVYKFNCNESSPFDSKDFIEYFIESDFRTFIGRKFEFKNTINKVDLEKREIHIKRAPTTSIICITKSDYSTVENFTNETTGKLTIINNQDKFFRNLINNTLKIFEKTEEVVEILPSDKSKNEKIITSITKNQITLLWGPPGTGKTYTIAKTINELLGKDRSLRFLVTGFTHLSIENCLKKIKELNDTKDTLVVKKFEDIKDKECYDLEITSAENETEALNTHILGSTVFKIDKFESIKFNYVIVDEASQMKIPEFLMTLKVANEKTHFLIVGDDKQLPPIVKNQYLNSDMESIEESKSIFSYMRAKLPQSVIQLQKSYRMNSVLCAFPSVGLYEYEFSPASTDIGNQKLELKFNYNIHENEYSEILNPDYPLVLCLVDSQEKKGNCSQAEADLSATLSLELHNALEDTEGFWGKHLSIISPHHSHIKLLKDSLNFKFSQLHDEKNENFFVDTVDKMQGQETDTAIVSYGITDPVVAMKEKDFIYNLNRFNVSTTRAKKKLIIILSKDLLEIDYRLIEDNDLTEHINYMFGYIDYIKERGVIISDNQDILTVYGVPFNSQGQFQGN